jgi:hypothetical protein
MKSEGVFSIVVLAVLGCIISVAVSYVVGHNKGYYQGAGTSKLYYEATSEFPTRDWLSAYEGNHFRYSTEILETLESYSR